jgi:hypothetical protein
MTIYYVIVHKHLFEEEKICYGIYELFVELIQYFHVHILEISYLR